MFSSLSPLSSCCCCGVCTGTSFVAIIHFLACVAVVVNSILHFIFHMETYGSVWSPEGLLLVTMFALMGVPVTFAAMLGAWLKLESYVRAYLIYFLASFVVVTGLLSWGVLVKDPCMTAAALQGELAKTYGDAFSCGIVRIGAYLLVALTVLPQTYALWCIWSFCEELRVGIHAPALEDLVIGQDKVFLWNPQEPLKQSMRSAQYGAVPVGGEHPIFGSEHETNYPPPRMY
ncbi:unnamed protein product [Durusdinium trenchii]|uniref:Uncharacterized protein n=1 Tax=Durusdinium trenchii TaxID=1381693 RepID=A0ABP0QKL5_9DINO